MNERTPYRGFPDTDAAHWALARYRRRPGGKFISLWVKRWVKRNQMRVVVAIVGVVALALLNAPEADLGAVTDAFWGGAHAPTPYNTPDSWGDD